MADEMHFRVLGFSFPFGAESEQMRTLTMDTFGDTLAGCYPNGEVGILHTEPELIYEGGVHEGKRRTCPAVLYLLGCKSDKTDLAPLTRAIAGLSSPVVIDFEAYSASLTALTEKCYGEGGIAYLVGLNDQIVGICCESDESNLHSGVVSHKPLVGNYWGQLSVSVHGVIPVVLSVNRLLEEQCHGVEYVTKNLTFMPIPYNPREAEASGRGGWELE